MTLFVILGEGEMPVKEVAHQLDDLWKKAEEDDTDFWFTMEAKPTMTDTDKALVDFFNKYDIHYGLMCLPDVKPDAGYTNAAEYLEVDPYTHAMELMQMVKVEGEDSVLLSLFSDDPDKDDKLVSTVTTVIKAGFKVLGLNDSLEPVELLTEEVKEVEVEEEAPKAKTKKRPPAPASEYPQKLTNSQVILPTWNTSEDEDEIVEPEPLNRQYLESLTASEVKVIATGMGLNGGSTKEQNISDILGEGTGYLEDVVVAATERLAKDSQIITEAQKVLVVIHRQHGMQTLWIDTEALDSWVTSL